MVRAKLNVRTCTTKRRPFPARGPSGSDGRLLIRQRKRNFRCSLIYKECPFLGGQAPPPAIPTSASPSKPVRPLVEAKSALFGTPAKGGYSSRRSLASPLQIEPAGAGLRFGFGQAKHLQRLPADFTLRPGRRNGRMRWELLLPHGEEKIPFSIRLSQARDSPRRRSPR